MTRRDAFGKCGLLGLLAGALGWLWHRRPKELPPLTVELTAGRDGPAIGRFLFMSPRHGRMTGVREGDRVLGARVCFYRPLDEGAC